MLLSAVHADVANVHSVDIISQLKGLEEAYFKLNPGGKNLNQSQ